MRLFKTCFLLSYALRDVLSASSNAGISVNVDLGSYFNNNGVSASPGSANFDGHNGSYPLNQLPTGILSYRGINVSFALYFVETADQQESVLVHASSMGFFVPKQYRCARAKYQSDYHAFSVLAPLRCR
jgi:hypothetical protein